MSLEAELPFSARTNIDFVQRAGLLSPLTEKKNADHLLEAD